LNSEQPGGTLKTADGRIEMAGTGKNKGEYRLSLFATKKTKYLCAKLSIEIGWR
jgi:hypothetical protein